MSILTRYLVRSIAGPFFFALGALTGLLFLNAIAQRLQFLAGKGLGWRVIGEFMMLSLPHTIALTLPCAILIAVLYAFSQLTSHSEITAMNAGGVKPRQLVTPMLVIGAILAGVTYYFNDSILPEANHQLRNLMVDIGNKSPTFQLREQVVNRIETGDLESRYFLQATHIDPVTNHMRDVTIHDLSDPARTRAIYADSGSMAFDREQVDLFLTLHDGTVFETTSARRGSLQKTGFSTQVIPIRGVGDVLERNEADTRSDREMNIAMLRDKAIDELFQAEQARDESLRQSLSATRLSLGIHHEDDSMMTAAPSAGGVGIVGAIEQHDGTLEIPDDPLTRGVIMSVRTSAMRADVNESWSRRYMVEVYKKLAISFACIVFVLIGLPVAVRYPRGGVGMVISVSVAIFGVYWMGLIGGENLADKGIVPPFLAMFGPNILFFSWGLYLVSRLGTSMATSRGGGWDELWGTVGDFVNPMRWFGRRKATAA